MEVNYIKSLEDVSFIRAYEKKVGIAFSKEFIEFFEKYNGGRPTPNTITIKNGEEKLINTFLSFNDNDKENVYKAKKRVSEDNSRVIPFAMDPSGDYFCLLGEQVVYFSHEDAEVYEVADSFENFLKSIK